MTIELSANAAFAQGGNRQCFVHPHFPDRCIKILRPDRGPQWRRQRKSFPKNLRPLTAFDDNLNEYRVMLDFQTQYPAAMFAHISRCYGFEETSLGRGLVSELLRDHDGQISQSLKLYLWHHGYTDACQAAVQRLKQHWINFRVPSRDLLVHNIVVQQEWAQGQPRIRRLVVIDGLGGVGLAAQRWLPSALHRRQAARKAASLETRIDAFMRQAESGVYPGCHGVPLVDGELQVPAPRQPFPEENRAPGKEGQ